MHIETLKTFCDLVETASFSKAAKLNLVSQSAVSQQVRALEQRYGHQLIERGHASGAIATEAGRLLYVESKELLDLAHAGLLRMADIVKSLLTFSRHAAIQQKPEPLARLVEEAVAGVAMAVADLAPKITSELAPDVAEHPVPRALHQVLTNVVRNAADATGPTGHVQVRARRDGDRVRIEVRDDGPGMPPGVLQRIFEPFFTTKPPGKGTGLGLPISARVVENLGGAITVECPPSGGTLVRVTLPFAPSGAPASAR